MKRRYLLMPIWAPMQSWGDLVLAGDDRPSLSFPTHSGLCGLIAAALGIKRDQWDQLREIHRSLDFLILECSKGNIETDFYSVTGFVRAEGLKPAPRDTFIGRKTYLTDYAFLVAVYQKEETSSSFSLEDIGNALLSPGYPLYAGRKSYTFSTAPVFHVHGKAQIFHWENPFEEMLLLKSKEYAHQKNMPNHSAISQTESFLFKNSRLPKFSSVSMFYSSEELMDEFQGIAINEKTVVSKHTGIPYTLRDKYIPTSLKLRRFEERKVYITSIQEENAISK